MAAPDSLAGSSHGSAAFRDRAQLFTFISNIARVLLRLQPQFSGCLDVLSARYSALAAAAIVKDKGVLQALTSEVRAQALASAIPSATVRDSLLRIESVKQEALFKRVGKAAATASAAGAAGDRQHSASRGRGGGRFGGSRGRSGGGRSLGSERGGDPAPEPVGP